MFLLQIEYFSLNTSMLVTASRNFATMLVFNQLDREKSDFQKCNRPVELTDLKNNGAVCYLTRTDENRAVKLIRAVNLIPPIVLLNNTPAVSHLILASQGLLQLFLPRNYQLGSPVARCSFPP